MTNAIIHLVTNRSGDFHHPSLGSVIGYTPHVESPEETTLRRFLHLKDTDSDYYVIGALGAIYAFPELVREYGEDGRTFDLQSWRKDDDAFYPGNMVNSRKDAFAIHRTPTEFPVALEWYLSYMDAQHMLIQVGTARYVVPVRVSATTLYVEWPDELGIQGAIALADTWTTGTHMTLRHTPVGFPYTELARQLTQREDARRLLTDRGYMSYFYAAQSDIEKCAVTYTALAWPSYYG